MEEGGVGVAVGGDGVIERWNFAIVGEWLYAAEEFVGAGVVEGADSHGALGAQDEEEAVG